MSRIDRTLAELRHFARLEVRAGYGDLDAVRAAVLEFVRAEVDDPDEAARLTGDLVAEAAAELAAEQATWPARTDNDALADALREIAERGYVVLEYCQDHYDATNALRSHPQAAGVVFFTETDVWHAITDRMLELKAWHADTSAMVAADPELVMIIDLLTAHGLPAVFDEGRIEVAMTWRRRPAGSQGSGSQGSGPQEA